MGLSAEDTALYKEEFSLFDEDGSNNISMDELGNVVRSLGFAPTMEQLKDWMAEFDVSKDGVLSLDEFLKMMEAKAQSKPTKEQTIEAFNIFDQDGTGKLSLIELRQNLCSMGEKLTEDEVVELFRHIDADGDGSISQTEFCTALYKTEF